MNFMNLICMAFGMSLTACILAVIALFKAMRCVGRVEELRFDVYRRKNRR